MGDASNNKSNKHTHLRDARADPARRELLREMLAGTTCRQLRDCSTGGGGSIAPAPSSPPASSVPRAERPCWLANRASPRVGLGAPGRAVPECSSEDGLCQSPAVAGRRAGGAGGSSVSSRVTG